MLCIGTDISNKLTWGASEFFFENFGKIIRIRITGAVCRLAYIVSMPHQLARTCHTPLADVIRHRCIGERFHFYMQKRSADTEFLGNISYGELGVIHIILYQCIYPCQTC